MAIEIPERLLVQYQSLLPPASAINSVLGQSGRGFVAYGMADAVNWTKFATANVAERLSEVAPKLPPGVEDALRDLWDVAVSAADLVGKSNAEIAEEIMLLVGEVFETTMSLVGTLSSIPIIGWIISAVEFVANIGLVAWKYKQARAEANIPTLQAVTYDSVADSFWQNELVQLAGSSDWTAGFLPWATGEPKSYRILNMGNYINRAWAYEDDRTGFGIIPGGTVYRSWFFNTDQSIQGQMMWLRRWADFRPGTMTAAAQLWDRLQVPGPDAFNVDLGKVKFQWDQWEYSLINMVMNKPRGPADRAWKIIQFGGDTSIPSAYRRNLRNPATGDVELRATTSATATYYVDQHRKRCEHLLGTLAVAYVREDAPAFQDLSLRLLLDTRRRQLLEHPSVKNVEPDACPDPEYRTALHAAKMQGGATELKGAGGGGPPDVVAKWASEALPSAPGAPTVPLPKPTFPTLPKPKKVMVVGDLSGYLDDGKQRETFIQRYGVKLAAAGVSAAAIYYFLKRTGKLKGLV